MSDNIQCTESCKLSYSLGAYPIFIRNKEFLNVFISSFWTLLYLICALLQLCLCDYRNTPENTFQMMYLMWTTSGS